MNEMPHVRLTPSVAVQPILQIPIPARRALMLAQVQAASGNRVEAEKLVHQVEDMAKRRYVCDFEIAQVYTVLGQKDQAFRWLNLGQKQQCDCLVWLQSEPWMDPFACRSALPRPGAPWATLVGRQA